MVSVHAVRTMAGRRVLWGMVVFMLGFAAWGWLRPYDWSPDPDAKAEIVGVELRRDQSFYWLIVHVRAIGEEPLDLAQPPRLVIRKERDLRTADVRLKGAPESGFQEAWLQFWLESGDVPGPLKLGLREGFLLVKSGSGMPDLQHGETRHFTTHRW